MKPKTLIQEHWEIYSRNSLTASVLGRFVMLGIILVTMFYGIHQTYTISYAVSYFILDVLQYVVAGLCYWGLATLQELGYVDNKVRPRFINYPAHILYLSKFIILILCLLNLGS